MSRKILIHNQNPHVCRVAGYFARDKMPFMQNPLMFKEKALRSRYRPVGLVLLLVVAFTVPLHAQMKIEKTEPAANSMNSTSPRQIQIWFNGAPAYGLTKINLTGPTGGVKLAALVFDGKSVSAAVVGVLPDGAYVATWQSAANGGRLQRGQFKFAVKTR
jgi:methionine-rich copper-binding protein CopC